MKKKYVFLVISILFTISGFGQNPSWVFNNNSLNGWSPFRFNSSFTPSSLILTTNGQANPRLDHLTANIDADTYKFAIIKLKVATGGPSLLRINYGANFKSTAITVGNSNFDTFILNMTDPTWTGVINNIQFAFRENDNTAGGTNYTSNGIPIEIEKIEFVENIYAGSTELFVDLNNGNNNNYGTYTTPLKSIDYALNTAANNNISNVYIKSGIYELPNTVSISTISTNPIVISPETNGNVVFRSQSGITFNFINGAKNIEFKNFELDGKSGNTDHWTLLSQYVWQPNLLTDAQRGAGIAFNMQSCENIKITNNLIHDYYQKAVNMRNGRYITISGNIIYNIALTSLSGGHGIMRQQGDGSFPDPDDTSKYRWDINGNLIFNVYQRIYSWVPAKGYLIMTLDEGKPILIDETPNHDLNMKARIMNNVVAYFKIDGIRIKPTNNLEVSNNSLFTTETVRADGITDTTTGYNGTDTPFLNFKCFNNAVDINPILQPYELVESIGSTGSTYGNNYSAFGSIQPSSVATNLNTPLFVSPQSGNFTLNTSPSIPQNIGVDPAILTDLANRAALFNVTIADSNWINYHLKNTQVLLDNVPGVEDGILNNENVFTDAGIYDISDVEFNEGRKSYYFSVNSIWKTNNGVTNSVLNHGNGLDIYDGKYEIVTPEDYSAWYDNIKATHLRDTDNNGIGDTPYNWIRYGESIIKQNKIFNDNSIHVIEIESNSNYTKTHAEGFNVTVDGDILIDFNYTPVGNEVFDLIYASTINSNNTSAIFDKVYIEGYSGTYTLEIITGSPNILRLTLTSTLGNPNFANNDIKLFPNPSTSEQGFNLNSNLLPTSKIYLHNSIGQKIDLNTVNYSDYINFKPVSKLVAGIYYITIDSGTSIQKMKWIVY